METGKREICDICAVSLVVIINIIDGHFWMLFFAYICIKSFFAQWAKYPAELDAAVLARLPYRENTDDR